MVGHGIDIGRVVEGDEGSVLGDNFLYLGVEGRLGKGEERVDPREARRRHHHRVGFDLLLQFGEQPIRVRRCRLRLGDREMFEREAIAGAALVQRIAHPGNRQAVLADAGLGVDPFGGSERGNMLRRRSRSTTRRADTKNGSILTMSLRTSSISRL